MDAVLGAGAPHQPSHQLTLSEELSLLPQFDSIASTHSPLRIIFIVVFFSVAGVRTSRVKLFRKRNFSKTAELD